MAEHSEQDEQFVPRPKKERLAQLAEQLEGSSAAPSLAALTEEIKATREAYVRALANGLMKASGPVDQREIDYKRGFWQGAVWATAILPIQAANELEKQRKAADAPTEEATA